MYIHSMAMCMHAGCPINQTQMDLKSKYIKCNVVSKPTNFEMNLCIYAHDMAIVVCTGFWKISNYSNKIGQKRKMLKVHVIYIIMKHFECYSIYIVSPDAMIHKLLLENLMRNK